MSYLTPGNVPVGYSLTRTRAEKGYKKEELVQFDKIPSRKRSLFGLALRYAFVDKSIAVVTEGLGSQPFHGRVVILVNEHSASASEMIAAFAIEKKLATIVGTKTPGRLLTGSTFRLGHGFLLGLPTASYLTWQGNLIEGKGVAPDIIVENRYEMLKAGIDSQLGAGIEKLKMM
jgi:carboxyl-terminal processing protease